MRVLVLAVLLVLVGCSTTKTSSSGHNCSDLKVDKFWWREHVHKFFINESISQQKTDSMFIEGEHICFIEDQLCSHEEDEWIIVVEH